MHKTIKHGSASHIGHVRAKNEDSFAVLACQATNCLAMILADGMGGHSHGELASRIAVDYARERLAGLLAQELARPAAETDAVLYDIVKKANEHVYQASLGRLENQGMGTTLTLVLVYPDQLLLAHVGDCRLYLLHEDELSRLTKDHTFVQGLVDAGSISSSETWHHPQRNVLTRALGTDEPMLVDLVRHSLQPGDRLLLCSDGLHGFVPETEIKEQLQSKLPPAGLAARLVELALALGGEDNITVLTADICLDEQEDKE